MWKVAQMADNDILYKTTTEVIHRTRQRGRPRLQWMCGWCCQVHVGREELDGVAQDWNKIRYQVVASTEESKIFFNVTNIIWRNIYNYLKNIIY